MAKRQIKGVPKASGGRPAKISRERILEEARQLAAGELTVPRIAQRLGVRPPALYYHFKSRDDLLNALALSLAQEFTIAPGNPKQWRPWLEDTALRFYDFFLANPALFDVHNWRLAAVMGTPIIESVLLTLEGAGFTIQQAGRTWEVISSMTYAEARLVTELRTAAPALAAAGYKPSAQPPRTTAWNKTLNPDPRQQFAQTLHWLIQALPKPQR